MRPMQGALLKVEAAHMPYTHTKTVISGAETAGCNLDHGSQPPSPQDSARRPANFVAHTHNDTTEQAFVPCPSANLPAQCSDRHSAQVHNTAAAGAHAFYSQRNPQAGP
jgi:hypothetical protein